MMTKEMTIENRNIPLGEKVAFGAKIIAKGIKDSLPHSAIGFGARFLTDNVLKSIDIVPGFGVLSVVGTAAYTTSKEVSRSRNLHEFYKIHVVDFDVRAQTSKGIRHAYNEAGGRAERLVVDLSFNFNAKRNANVVGLSSSEVLSRYMAACGDNRDKAIKAMRKDFAETAVAHRVAFGAVEKAYYSDLGMVLYKCIKDNGHKEIYSAVKSEKFKARVKSIAGIVAIKSVKAFAKFSGGVWIAKEVGSFFHFISHTPTAADGHYMTLARSMAKTAPIQESSILQPLNIEGQTASLATDMNLNSGGGVVFTDLRTSALETKAMSLSALATVKVNDLNDLTAVSKDFSAVSTLLNKTVTVSNVADGGTITVGDVMMSMGSEKALKAIDSAGGLVKLASDRDAAISFATSLKSTMAPTWNQIEIGKQAGTLWNAIEAAGYKPTEMTIADFMNKVKLESMGAETRNAVLNAFNMEPDKSITFAAFNEKYASLLDIRGWRIVLNGDTVAFKQDGLIVQSGAFKQALNALDAQPVSIPNAVTYELVRENGRWIKQAVTKRVIQTTTSVSSPVSAPVAVDVKPDSVASTGMAKVSDTSAAVDNTKYELVRENGRWIKKAIGPVEPPKVITGVVKEPTLPSVVEAPKQPVVSVLAPEPAKIPEKVKAIATVISVPVQKEITESNFLKEIPQVEQMGNFRIGETPISFGSSKFNNIFRFSGDEKLKLIQWDGVKLRPDDGTAMVYTNEYGGWVWIVHDGYSVNGGAKHFAEGLRAFWEGGNYKDPKFARPQMDKFIGQSIGAVAEGDQSYGVSRMELVNVARTTRDQIESGHLLNKDYWQIGGGPGTIAFITCAQSHVDAIDSFLKEFANIIPSDLKKYIDVINEANSKGSQVEEAFGKLLDWLKIYDPVKYELLNKLWSTDNTDINLVEYNRFLPTFKIK